MIQIKDCFQQILAIQVMNLIFFMKKTFHLTFLQLKKFNKTMKVKLQAIKQQSYSLVHSISQKFKSKVRPPWAFDRIAISFRSNNQLRMSRHQEIYINKNKKHKILIAVSALQIWSTHIEK